MKQVIIMPGGFHPFHAGHYALYKQAQDAFPDADVYVAATNDTSARPFPFAVKEKLAKLAGVEPGHFVQVKSPFQAREITANLDPADTQLIFVRSEKDANKPPQAGGVKKDGNPAYLQPLAGQEELAPMAQHAYMAYLPTVEFGPGMTSATEIRTAWPRLNERRKTALVMSLYPKTQSNPALAANVVKMLNTAMGSEEQGVAEARNNNGVEVSNIQPGDTITWWYNRAHPNYEGQVREVRGSTLIVYAPGSGSLYQLSKDDIRSHEKGVSEGWKEKVAGGALALGALGGIGALQNAAPNTTFQGHQLQLANPGTVPGDAKIVTDDNGQKIYAWKTTGFKNRSQWVYRPVEELKEDSQVERKISRVLAMIQDYHDRSRATKNDIKKNHYLAMADQLQTELDRLLNDANKQERDSNMVSQHDAQPSDTWNRGGLIEFAPSDSGSGRKFIPWPEFIEAVKQIVGRDFDVVEKVVKSTIQDRFVPHDPMEHGPTMLYSYYEARAGRGKGAVSTRGSIQVGKYVPNTSKLGTQNYITTFNLLKGHPFERHFDLTFDNIYKIANIIMGNTEGAYQMQPQGVAEDYIDEKK